MTVTQASPETSLFPTVPVSAEIFESHPEAAFWIGKIANLGASGVGESEYANALGRFRANVYVHELAYLDEDVVDVMGRELDEYDERSIQFAVVENGRTEGDASRIVGSLRLITKESPENLYPIEKYFPELFEEPIGTNSAEVSRFIARYPGDKFMKHVISLSLIRAATLYADREQIESYYCIIEDPLLGLLKKIGIPLEAIGESKNIPEQGGVLHPIRINSQKILDSVTVDKTGNIMLEDFFKQELGSGGEGYYPADLVGGTYE